MTGTMPNRDLAREATALIESHAELYLCTIGGVPFGVLPASYRQMTARLQYTVPTAAGFTRFDFGIQPITHHLQGTTGLQGLAGLRVLEQFRPLTNRAENLLPFVYSQRFSGVKMVYVNSFEDTMNTETPLFNFYEIELVEYPSPQSPSVNKISTNTGIAIAITPPQ